MAALQNKLRATIKWSMDNAKLTKGHTKMDFPLHVYSCFYFSSYPLFVKVEVMRPLKVPKPNWAKVQHFDTVTRCKISPP